MNTVGHLLQPHATLCIVSRRSHVTGMFSCHVGGQLIKDVADTEHNGLDSMAKVRSELHVVAEKEEEEEEKENDFKSLTESDNKLQKKRKEKQAPSFYFVAVLPVQLSIML